MPSFDIVSETDMQEMSNAVNQVIKEITTRYDFKGSKASIELTGNNINVVGDDINKLNTVTEILRAKLVRRKLETSCLDYNDAEDASGGCKRQEILIKQGVSIDLAKKIVKMIKQEKMKVQASIQGEQVRVTGKKRDELQSVMSLVRGMDTDRPLSFTNFRD
ncbi:MAG: YajQ family cyclic di-GMP-binding protein [Mariprofundus sp.]|nr:YajQ family cyclic di-GMP-binding protein [Mariprofundus sp.]